MKTKNGILKGLSRKAVAGSKSMRATKARVIPQPGQRIPVRCLKGQIMGLPANRALKSTSVVADMTANNAHTSNTTVPMPKFIPKLMPELGLNDLKLFKSGFIEERALIISIICE